MSDTEQATIPGTDNGTAPPATPAAEPKPRRKRADAGKSRVKTVTVVATEAGDAGTKLAVLKMVVAEMRAALSDDCDVSAAFVALVGVAERVLA
jgi:hypothetical protein